MASQNRRTYRNSSSQSGGLAFVRGTFIMLVVLILSFGLGFFVLARFMPGSAMGSPKAENSHAGVAIAATRGERETAERLPTPSTAQPAPRTQTPKPVAPKPDIEGPTIAPGEEATVQPPGQIDEPVKRGQNPDEPKADPKEQPAPRHKTTPRAKADPENKPDTNDLPGPSKMESSRSDAPLPGAVKPRKAGHKPAKPSTEDDFPKPRTETMPPIGPAMPQPRDNGEGKTAPAVGVYRVQLGAFESREQADAIVKQAQDKGFNAQIKVIKKGSQTLYKVQHSAHKTRANAEKEGQKLTDAGFNVYISNPAK